MNDDLPSIDLLEATHPFPCPYTFKVIGQVEDQFVGRVLLAVRSEIDSSEEPPFSTRKSSGGRHICVTIEPNMASAEHVLTVYRRLKEVEGVVMVF